MHLPCPFIPPPIVLIMDNDAVAHGMYLLITPLFLRKKKLITTCILCWFGLFGRGSDYIYLLRHAKFADEVFFSLLSSFFFNRFNTCRLFCNHSFSFLIVPLVVVHASRAKMLNRQNRGCKIYDISLYGGAYKGGNWLLLCLQQIVSPHCLGRQKQQAHTTGGLGDIRLALNSTAVAPCRPQNFGAIPEMYEKFCLAGKNKEQVFEGRSVCGVKSTSLSFVRKNCTNYFIIFIIIYYLITHLKFYYSHQMRIPR